MANNKNIPQPKTKGVVKVPVVMQLEVLECGAASLTMIMHYYRKWIPLEQARGDCGVSRDGANAKNIILAARSYGMEAKAWRVDPEDLIAEGPFPCIIHWGFNHFVVLCGFRHGKAVLNDPARGRVEVSMEEFDREYTGVMITVEPGPDFEPSGKRKTVFSYAKQRLAGTSSAVIFVVLTTTISSLMGIISPVFGRVFLDRLLSGRNPEWLTPFIVAMSAFAIINIVVLWIATVYSLRIQGKMEAVGSSSYLWKVLRLPMQFFQQRLSAVIPGQAAHINRGIRLTRSDRVAVLPRRRQRAFIAERKELSRLAAGKINDIRAAEQGIRTVLLQIKEALFERARQILSAGSDFPSKSAFCILKQGLHH